MKQLRAALIVTSALWVAQAAAQTAPVVEESAPAALGEARFAAVESEVRFDVAGLVERVLESGAVVVFIGEIHDNETHHALQAALTAAFEATRGVDGLVFEMITLEREPAVNAARGWPRSASTPPPADEVGRTAARLGEILEWDETGWPAWRLYAPIVVAAPRAYIAGGGAPRSELAPFLTGVEAARAALASDADAQAAGFDAPLSPRDQAAREDMQIAAHCDAIPRAAATAMVALQRLRDARLAAAVVRTRDALSHRRRGRDVRRLIIVITGNGHARRDHGAPAALAAMAPELRSVSIGLFEGDLVAARAAGRGRFDHVAAAPAPEGRGDPCAAFRARHGGGEAGREGVGGGG